MSGDSCARRKWHRISWLLGNCHLVVKFWTKTLTYLYIWDISSPLLEFRPREASDKKYDTNRHNRHKEAFALRHHLCHSFDTCILPTEKKYQNLLKDFKHFHNFKQCDFFSSFHLMLKFSKYSHSRGLFSLGSETH